MLAAGCVDKNVLDIGERRGSYSRLTGVCLGDGARCEVQARGTGLRQPDGMGFISCQTGVNESSRGPTPRREPAERADE